ncbi:TetR/AcrR family transcriptional regulator [Nocardia sp. CDC160]|uniref:TetR/AcrR family transcriptional regulator n=1 Tax=Nocardia sp. CDC160 TaxID=3112166 RepID=UPI002DBB58DF|nr:TetR/AcrR family transcriptional regulator [Nocardia sp. CDC160]MEC3920249.1 TetR/AcrR family transcriptional regulator [Nocardia sp. CDC160]
MTNNKPYHHGDLRRAMLAVAVAAIDEQGPTSVSLRDLARRAGVSHAAPVHHFGDKAGLLTALATEGFDLLADYLADAVGRGIVELGVRYVRFATDHRAHFEVMFRPDLYRADDPDVSRAGDRAYSLLAEGIGAEVDEAEFGSAVVAAWSLVHGFATLWNVHMMPSDVVADPAKGARVIGELFARAL